MAKSSLRTKTDLNKCNYDECRKKILLNSIIRRKNGCWEWKKSKNKKGYGLFSYKSKGALAHRISWMLHNGEIDKDLLVCHHCDNPCCINPKHLFLGTYLDNRQDCLLKNRMPCKNGERSGNPKLDNGKVFEIRKMYDQYIKTKIIAEKFNVSRSAIYNIINRKTWKHVWEAKCQV